LINYGKNLCRMGSHTRLSYGCKVRAGDEANKVLLNQINWMWVANLMAKKPELNPSSAELLDWVTSGQIDAMRK